MVDNTLILYGFHAVLSALSRYASEIQLLMIDAHRNDARMQQLLEFAAKKGVKVERQSRVALDKLVENTHHQGVIAIVTPPRQVDDLKTFLDSKVNPFLLILDGIQDPHNLGACLRTANAAGVDAVIAPKDRAVGLTPVVAKVSSGATLFTPFYQVTNLARTLKMLKDRGIWLYGTSEHAEELYSEVNFGNSIAIVMGSEGKGLRRLIEEHCDYLIKIPMLGSVPSLNVSVATGICLFEAVRQRWGSF